MTDLETAARLFYQHEMESAEILFFEDPHLFYFNQEGLSYTELGNLNTTKRFDLDGWAEFDELFFIPSLGHLVLATYLGKHEDENIILRFFKPELDSEWVEIARLKFHLPYTVRSLQLIGEQFFGYFEMEESSRPRFSMCTIEIDRQVASAWQVHVRIHPWCQVDGLPMALIENRLMVTYESQIPYAPLFRVYTADGISPVSFEGYQHVMTGSQFIYAGQDGKNHLLGYVGGDGEWEEVQLSGYVKNLIADSDRLIIQLYQDGCDCVMEIKLPVTPLSEPKMLLAGTERKTVFSTSSGLVSLKYNFCEGLVLEKWDSLRPDFNAHSLSSVKVSLGDWGNYQTQIEHICSPQGAEAIILTATDGAHHTTLLHFHGGPDSYSVEDLRLFGALRELAMQGFQIISLNYRGSTGLNQAAYLAPRQAWHVTVPEDVGWLVDSGALSKDIPCIAVGWSFGGTLSLLTAAQFEFVGAVVCGGFMASLSAHRQQAYKQDACYRTWFLERFGPDDGLVDQYFELENQMKRSISVLSFHGKEDPHCRYEDAQLLRQHCVSSGFDWTHYDLPAGDHYAETIEGAHLIYQQVVAFCQEQSRMLAINAS